MRRAAVLGAAALLTSLTVACDGQSEGRPSPIPESCLIGGAAPQSIPDAIERINSLPRPLSIACFVASLPRPLSLVATNSPFSAQPAASSENPRIFILTDGLVLSVVPAGSGARLLEFAEWVTDTRTIKGELPFPVEDTLSEDAPYDVLFNDTLTNCGLCHRNEDPAPDRPGAFISDAMRPEPDHYAAVAPLFDELENCDWDNETERCEILSALLDFGPVEEVAFADEVDTFFE